MPIRYLDALIISFAFLISFHAHAISETITERQAREMMESGDTGDKSQAFESYKLEKPDPKYAESDCETTIDDIPPAALSGPAKYSCRVTRLGHFKDDSTILKFSAIACRTNKYDDASRHRAWSVARNLIIDQEIKYLEAQGMSTNQRLEITREKFVCKRLAFIDGVTNNSHPAIPGQSLPQYDPNTVPPTTSAPSPEAAPPSHPQSATVFLRNNDRRQIDIKFFSQLTSKSWPGNGQVYYLDPGQSHKYSLACDEGEKICYGAWREKQNTFWGAGKNNDRSCKNCCVTCGGDKNYEIGDAGADTAPTVRFVFHNTDRYSLGVAFYSQTRDGRWPAPGRQYKLTRNDTFDLSCQVGERVCFGAWRDYQTTTWGVGHDKHNACGNCCTVCGNTFETTLTDGGPDQYPSKGSGVSADAVVNFLSALAGAAVTIHNSQGSSPSGGNNGNSGYTGSDISGTK